MTTSTPQPNTPTPILADECLLPGGSRVVVAPADGWTPKKPQPKPVSEAAWWAASLGTSFLVGVMLCLLVVAVMFKIGGARIVLRGGETAPATERLPDMLDTATAAGDVREGPGGSGEAVAP